MLYGIYCCILIFVRHLPHIRLITLIVLLFVFFALPSLTAQPFPQPGNDEEVSLLGVYYQRSPGTLPGEVKGKIRTRIEGPDRLSLLIDASEWGVLWFKVEEGVYSIIADENIKITPGVSETIHVPQASVVLAPFILERSANGVAIQRLNEEVRQKAGRDLALHFNYPQWLGRNLIGFGTLRPSLDPETLQFRVNISTDPESAEIFVDDVLAGTAPLGFSLTGGKHRILIRYEGFEDAIYYVRLEGDADIDAVLKPAEAAAMEGGKEKYSTLVAPFVSVTGQNDQFSRLFADTLLLTLENDERLDVKPSALPWVQRDALIHPDFLPLEEVGADLVVSGFFSETDGKLSIQANLYDVQAETIRAAVTWYGTAGFDIFDAMDEIAEEFAHEVDRVLPAAGRALITRQETIFSGVDRSESLLARKKIIRKRWREQPNVLTFQSGMGGIMEEFTVSDGAFTSTAGLSDGPVIPLIFSWDRDINSRFAAGTGVTIGFNKSRNEYSGGEEQNWFASAFAGPRMVFRSLRADIYLGIDFQISYFPRITEYWDDSGPRQADLGPLLYLELPMKIGLRYYFNRRIDTMPLFLNAALGITPLGYHFDLGGGNQNGMMSTGILLNIGMGVRL